MFKKTHSYDRLALLGLSLLALLLPLAALSKGESDDASVQKMIERRFEALDHRLDQLEKAVDDILWYNKVGDVAVIDKVFQYGPPPANIKNPTAMGAQNPVKFWSYIFIPKGIDCGRKYPLLVLPHGGVHANFTTYHTHIIRELMAQGYVVVAPEYRGSTGYGQGFYERIDYGGREIDDCHASRAYMVENYEFVDGARVGLIGWSHGGLIALMNIFEHPDDYQAAFAGVPVSDLVMRLGYQSPDYPEEFAAPYHIGKTVNEDVKEYQRRSPVWHVKKLQTPLLIHTNTNDDDVYSIEVEHLIQALKVEGKKFEYEIFKDAPGGHSFDRIDTRLAKEIRLKIYKFLAGYLHPAHPFASLADLNRAGYR
ncbi:MAG: prolyl oligopeptidase family serine peptidase [Candidatus Aminicenantes bacterium]|nr:prolyl oligopeptidase family serine peptidase [Candidatus Aminicenantes bacterium]